jgi:cytochrome oxidase Cu insertion factor (SCO1/SenC/PrrC family)
MERRDAWPLGAIGFILIVSAAWWGFALWSVPGAPDWLERTRSVCFNITESGLPDAKGWLLLVGQPPTMLAMLLAGWWADVRSSLVRLVSFPQGRMAALGVVTVTFTGLTLAGAKVIDARVPEVSFGVDEPAPETYPRLDRAWPSTEGLSTQGDLPFDLARLEGRNALVTFAFGHCATICPVVVHQARAVRLETGLDLAIVVFTLDPWRDTPSRLPALLEQFDLDPDGDFMVSGSVEHVNAALDTWNIPRDRDEVTGDITHPGIVYMVESDGTIAYGSTGGVAQMVSLARRLR